MDIQNNNEEEKKSNLGLCMSAGIETPNDEDPTRFQRRHFPNKMTSNIFFCDSPLEDEPRKSRGGAGLDTHYNDQKQSEKRHFHLSSENGSMTRDYPDQDEGDQVDSSETVESNKSRDNHSSDEINEHNVHPEQSEKFSNQDEEEQVDSAESKKTAGYLSEEIDERNGDQQQSEDDTANRDEEEVESSGSGTAGSKETEENDSDQKKTQRRHFHNKMESNIFFSGLPIENISLRESADFRKRKD